MHHFILPPAGKAMGFFLPPTTNLVSLLWQQSCLFSWLALPTGKTTVLEDRAVKKQSQAEGHRHLLFLLEFLEVFQEQMFLKLLSSALKWLF